MAKSPEEPAWWQLADTAVNHRDGWAHAVETGLLVHVVVPATHRYLAHEGHVPYERLEAYQEAMALWLRTERALEARTDGARGRALALAGDGLLTNRKVTLTTDQLERLLALIPQEEGT